MALISYNVSGKLLFGAKKLVFAYVYIESHIAIFNP